MSTAAAMTYDSLCKDVLLYAERNDEEFVNQVPRLIMLAENDIASKVRGLGMIKVVSGQMRVGESAFPKPTRWRESVSFNFTRAGERKHVYLRTYEFCRRLSPDDSVRGIPRYYGDYTSEHFLIAPAPDTAYNFELRYYERPDPLSESLQTNWTTQNAPGLILYATLLQAQPFLKNDARAATFKGMYDEIVASLAAEAQRRTFDASAGLREA
jgi:hypothetical protein